MGGVNNYQQLLDQGYTQSGPETYGGNKDDLMRPAGTYTQSYWNVPMTGPEGDSIQARTYNQPDMWGYSNGGLPTALSGNYGTPTRGKTTDELAAEEIAKATEIANRKSAYDAQMNQQFTGNFDFLNQPMEINPFQVQDGQAIMGRPTYNGAPPDVGNYTMSSAFNSRGAQPMSGYQPQGQQPQGSPDLGQMYNLFNNPYLAELATLLFGNSSWLNK